MSNHRLERFANVNIIGGPHAGEKGRILELLTDKHYGVKVMTGPDAHQKGTFVAQEHNLEAEPEAEPVQPLIDRLHIRATIRRSITTRKSVQEGQPDRISDLLDEAGTELTKVTNLLRKLVVIIEDAPEFEVTWKDVADILEARKYLNMEGVTENGNR